MDGRSLQPRYRAVGWNIGRYSKLRELRNEDPQAGHQRLERLGGVLVSTVIRTIEIGESIAAWPRVTIEDKAKLVTDLAKGIEPNKGPYVISCDTDA